VICGFRDNTAAIAFFTLKIIVIFPMHSLKMQSGEPPIALPFSGGYRISFDTDLGVAGTEHSSLTINISINHELLCKAAQVIL
jgi:hypothetical protein